jgi:hypothetical protein
MCKNSCQSPNSVLTTSVNRHSITFHSPNFWPVLCRVYIVTQRFYRSGKNTFRLKKIKKNNLKWYRKSPIFHGHLFSTVCLSRDKIFYFDWFIVQRLWYDAEIMQNDLKKNSKLEMSSLKVGTAISIISGWKQAFII